MKFLKKTEKTEKASNIKLTLKTKTLKELPLPFLNTLPAEAVWITPKKRIIFMKKFTSE